MSTMLLAGSIREANAYRLDTGDRHARLASTPAQLKNATKIIELPGFTSRRDRFALAQARDNRVKFGRTPCETVDATDWVAPPRIEAMVLNVLETLNEDLQFGDLTDQATLDALKAALNEVGLTLKKLPQKAAPVVDAPVEF